MRRRRSMLAQPALSQQIGELEERLGIVLLERRSRGVRPTAAGEIVFSEATEILRQLEQLPGIVRSSSGDVEGVVNFGMTVGDRGRPCRSCRARHARKRRRKVTLKFSDGDSDVLAGQDRGAGARHGHRVRRSFRAKLLAPSALPAASLPGDA